MTLTLSELLEGIHPDAAGAPAIAVRGVQYDSRCVSPGDVFVAIEGLTVDGHRFAEQAVRAGAVALICQRPVQLVGSERSVPCIMVADSSRALGLISAKLCGAPTQKLVLSGVTGTNGKSTTAFVLREILRAAQLRAGMLGTIEYSDGQESVPAPYTTPTAPELQGWLARMVETGCSHAVMEVSSHGLQLGRTWGCEFAVAAFSNLTQDHLDLHGDMERYLQAKLLLFSRHLRRGGAAVVNVDGDGSDAVLRAVGARTDVRLLRCSSAGRPAEVALEELAHGLEGFSGTLRVGVTRQQIRSPLVGAFNADNVLLAASCAHALGIAAEQIVDGVGRLGGIPGRLERVQSGSRAEGPLGPGDSGLSVFVDYAHTPDALARALDVLRPLCRGRLLVVFGCGGDRDRAKRPLMGRAAAQRADIVVLTSDNPRSEDPAQILSEIVPALADHLPRLRGTALDRSADRGYWVQADRADAIQSAVAALSAEDVLLLAGKGHETYQLRGDERLPFDDREQARAALKRRGASGG